MRQGTLSLLIPLGIPLFSSLKRNLENGVFCKISEPSIKLWSPWEPYSLVSLHLLPFLPIILDTQTTDILTATHRALNISNPTLAQDCWLCLSQGTPMPLAVPTNISALNITEQNCTLSIPFRVQPMLFYSSPCIYKKLQNNSFDISVGFASFTNCSHTLNYSTSLCPGPG